MWIYRKGDDGTYEVGWLERVAEDGRQDLTVVETTTSKPSAQALCHYLNGGNDTSLSEIKKVLDRIELTLDRKLP